jgi:oligosaccharyltransferase complex subunit alpha (ribophorin I)
MRLLTALTAAFAATALAFDPAAWENTQIVRTYELGGATTNVQTVYTVRALKNVGEGYELVLRGPEEGEDGTDYWEVSQGGRVWDSLTVSSATDGYVPFPSHDHALTVWCVGRKQSPSRSTRPPSRHSPSPKSSCTHHTRYPNPLDKTTSSSSCLSGTRRLSRVCTRRGRRPSSTGTSLFPTDTLCAYATPRRSPSKKILSYAKAPETFLPVGTAPSKKSGGTLTLGPYASVPPTVALSSGTIVREGAFAQVPMHVHYPYEEPVRTVDKLTRLVEVSHWGGNVNVEDHVGLVNTGAK